MSDGFFRHERKRRYHPKTIAHTGKRQDRRPRMQSLLFPDIATAEFGLVGDGACNRFNEWEYQGVWLDSRSSAFKSPVYPKGTNNLAEFLGLIEGLKLIKKRGLDCPVYSDSQIAICWVRKKAHKCGLANKGELTPEVQKLLDDAVNWLYVVDSLPPIVQWRTRLWGENPADYGRK
jgi:ribonuclease HI